MMSEADLDGIRATLFAREAAYLARDLTTHTAGLGIVVVELIELVVSIMEILRSLDCESFSSLLSECMLLVILPFMMALFRIYTSWSRIKSLVNLQQNVKLLLDLCRLAISCMTDNRAKT